MSAPKPWTKADRERVNLVLAVALDHTGHRHTDFSDDKREKINTGFALHLRSIVVDGLRYLAACNDKERRCMNRLANRIEREGLPDDIKPPRLPLHSEILADLRAEREREAARVEAEAERARPVPFVPRPIDPERERAALAREIAEVVKRGEVHVARFDSDPFNGDASWSDAGAVSWRAWARPACERRGVGTASAWDRCTSDAAKMKTNGDPLAVLWSYACSEEMLPDVLDLRGVPEGGGPGGLPAERWREPLAQAVSRSARGVVILVDGEAWALARLLPTRVGA